MRARVYVVVEGVRTCVELDVPVAVAEAERVRSVLVAAVRLGASLLDAGTHEYPVQGQAEVLDG